MLRQKRYQPLRVNDTGKLVTEKAGSPGLDQKNARLDA